MHTYAYIRVSREDQTTANQLLEIRTAGYQPDSVYSEVCSGKVAAIEIAAGDYAAKGRRYREQLRRLD